MNSFWSEFHIDFKENNARFSFNRSSWRLLTIDKRQIESEKKSKYQIWGAILPNGNKGVVKHSHAEFFFSKKVDSTRKSHQNSVILLNKNALITLRAGVRIRISVDKHS